MRLSDWSSDVCSSVLGYYSLQSAAQHCRPRPYNVFVTSFGFEEPESNMKFSLTIAALAAVLATAGVQAAGPQAAPANPQQAAYSAGQNGGSPPPDHRNHERRGFGGHGMHRGHGHGSPLMREIRRLQLSDAQDDAIDAVSVKHHAEQRELFKRRRDQIGRAHV